MSRHPNLRLYHRSRFRVESALSGTVLVDADALEFELNSPKWCLRRSDLDQPQCGGA
jgi:hypothetical protein